MLWRKPGHNAQSCMQPNLMNCVLMLLPEALSEVLFSAFFVCPTDLHIGLIPL